MMLWKKDLSEARREWIKTYIATITVQYHTENSHTNHNVGEFSTETTKVPPQWKSTNSEHELRHTSQEVRQTTIATDAWRAFPFLFL